MRSERSPGSLRTRARTLWKRGDLLGARRVLEESLVTLEGVERAAVEADLKLLQGEIEALATSPIDEPLPDAFPDEDGLVGTSGALAKIRRDLAKAAGATAPVLIEGPGGTGKDLIARALHRRGPRPGAPFVVLESAALAHGMAEAELFGHAENAFTGATSARTGLLVEAGDGTLLVDAIDEMPLEIQSKLLRVLEGDRVRPVGGGGGAPFRARIVATARRPLSPLVKAGTFRADLLYRVQVLRIVVPALRERPEDIPRLVSALLARHAGGRPVPSVTAGAIERLVEYPWPGNVRELENEVRRLLVLGAATIEPEHLSPAVRSGAPAAGDELSSGLYVRLRGRSIEEIERAAILTALRASGGNVSRAARTLKISRFAFYDKLKRYKIDHRERG